LLVDRDYLNSKALDQRRLAPMRRQLFEFLGMWNSDREDVSVGDLSNC
jgi:hypothetical protein